METNAIPQLNKILQVNNELLGLPALPLVFIGCIVLGMFLKAIPIYSNRWIPAGVFVGGILLNLGISPFTWAGATRSTILGLIAGGGAWIAYQKVVKKWITTDDLKSSDTTFTKKEP